MNTIENLLLQKELVQYPDERIRVLVFPSVSILGKSVALRFISWVQEHPEGVVSLPTGKTPEWFIKESTRFLSQWTTKDVQKELSRFGINTSKRPTLRGVTFVQMDDFFPINPERTNSFYHYVHQYYLKPFGFGNAMLINVKDIISNTDVETLWTDEQVDLNLRYRHPKTRKEYAQKEALQKVDEWCMRYEEKIRQKGGIGFFLGGIGPDGHIAFNIKGSDFHSSTRLTEINYETQAAAAQDLGGIEIARKRLAITIGLETITYNNDVLAIIMAAGCAKSSVVASSIQSAPTIKYPATVLQKLPNAWFYLSEGAASALNERSIVKIRALQQLSDSIIERIVFDTALATKKAFGELNSKDFRGSALGKVLLSHHKDIKKITQTIQQRFVKKLDRGIHTVTDKVFLHTEPHHDDIMLAYLPFVVRNIRIHSNTHYFVTLTSGFTAVSNQYIASLCKRLLRSLKENLHNFFVILRTEYFYINSHDHLNADVWHYLDGLAQSSVHEQERGTLGRFLRNIILVYNVKTKSEIMTVLEEISHYCHTHYPGTKDNKKIQELKGHCREWESACLWGYFGWESRNLENMNLGFYKGDIFNEAPTIGRDVEPILALLRRVRPDIISLAFDPEASGPDTHYKVLQALSEATLRYQEESNKPLEIIGYRNIWSQFHPSEVNIFVPVSLNMFALQNSSFMHTYLSQKDASFPSYEYDGPFCDLAQEIQNQQYIDMKTCLGEKFFYEHTSALIRATRGLVYLVSMTVEELNQYSQSLRKHIEEIG